MKIDRTGEIGVNNFGSEMVIVGYRSNKDIDVHFPEYNWTIENAQYRNFTAGKIKCPYEPRVRNVGYIGVGQYNVRENGKITKAYSVWQDMMARCYDSNFQTKKARTYVDCEVCEEWHNYQAFAEWYEQNYYEIEGQKMNLDKDILVKGNKTYSPDTCILVPHNINLLFTKSDSTRGNYPIGVYYKNNKYSAHCSVLNRDVHIGYYDDPMDAFQAYKEFKENYIKTVADQYIDLIPQALYNAMYEYEVENED